MLSTFYPKDGDIECKWCAIDAIDTVLGHLATRVVDLLRGKDKAYFAPNVDRGDHVVVVSADEVYVSSNRWEYEMRYHRSGFPGDLKSMTLGHSLEVHPEHVIAEAIEGTMPHNELSRASVEKLHAFADSEHPLAGQKPEDYEIKAVVR